MLTDLLIPSLKAIKTKFIKETAAYIQNAAKFIFQDLKALLAVGNKFDSCHFRKATTHTPEVSSVRARLMKPITVGT